MANLKSAVKRINTNERKREHNHAFKSEMRTYMKYVEELVNANDVDNAKTAYKDAVSKIDHAVSKGAIHRNNGSRQKVRLNKMMNKLSA